jgi:methylated-DNA-[protein]-cysteine S-methyltransferase
MVLAATPRGLSGIWFDGQRHGPDTSVWQRAADAPVIHQAMEQLTAYFAGHRRVFDLPLDLCAGTAFQQRVWQALLQIAPGDTTSYGALSARIGSPTAVRAVGAAVGRNPVCIVVPCHRVIGSNGSLIGYAGGLERKTALLALEGARLH